MICPHCYVSIVRESIAVSSTVTACGGEGTGLAWYRKVKPALLKQESNCKAGFTHNRAALRKFGGTVLRACSTPENGALRQSKASDRL